MCLGYVIPRFPALSETFLVREVLGLKELGHQVAVFSFRRPSQQDLALMNEEWRQLVRSVHYVERPRLIKAAVRSLFTRGTAVALNHRLERQVTVPTNRQARFWRACALAAEIERRQVSHLHAHWPYGSQVTALVHEITGVPHSVSIHAHEVAHNNGHFPIIFETLSFAVFCNEAAMEFLLARLPAGSRSRAYLVYHGVDLRAFPACSLSSLPPPLRVVSAGRLTRTKGFDRLVQGCARAARAGVDVQLTILGQGALDDALRQQARELGFADRLQMPGWVSHAQIRDYLARAHVFALLAEDTYHDGLPNVVLEAMACARPVILSPLPATPEVVTDGREGFVLEAPDDLDGLVTALQVLARQPDRLAEMGLAARTRVAAEHDAQVHIQRLAKLFEEQRAEND